jgi:hypothetical protein
MWNYWVFGLWLLSGILKKLENTTFWKLVLFITSGEWGRQLLFDPLETANLNHWTTYISITAAI